MEKKTNNVSANPNEKEKFDIRKYTTADKDVIFEEVEKIDGFPIKYPQKNAKNKKVFLSFVDAYIENKSGLKVGSNFTFDILEGAKFDSTDKEKVIQLNFIRALIDENFSVQGGLYFKGNYYTNKFDTKFARKVFKNFLTNYLGPNDKNVLMNFFKTDDPTLFPYIVSTQRKLDLYSIASCTTEDKEFVYTFSKMINGFPALYPSKDKKGKRIIISFVDAYICDANKNKIDDEIANFNFYEQDVFDRNDELANTKVKFIKALLSPDYIVQGGVYYKGAYYTNKMTVSKAKFLLKSFINNYFYIEDKDILLENFNSDSERIPFWPTKSHNDSKILMFSAVNATIERIGLQDKAGPYSFDIYAGEALDFNNKEDQKRIEVIRSLVDEDRIVKGFYYKGSMLADKLSKDLKEYLIKNFVKKNFYIEQKERLLTYIPKDPKSGYPLFWPCFNKDGRPVCISVINASADWIVDDKYSNFDVFDDENFDLTKEEYRTKLKVILQMFFKSAIISGALYFDGVLVNFDYFDKNNIEHRKTKVEKALKIHILDSEDFGYINANFNTSDRNRLIRLSRYYDNYYPNNIDEVMNYWVDYKTNPDCLLMIQNANFIDENGDYVLNENVNARINVGQKISDDNVLRLLRAIYNIKYKVRGAVYYKGVNIAKCDNKAAKAFFMNEYKQLVGFASKSEGEENFVKHQMSFDPYSGLPLYWPTVDEKGRRVLLSVVDADVHFKVGRGVVKAVNNATFDIYEGETFGLVGESGSGKTTISRAILGINKLTKGAIYFDGKLISSKMSKEDALNTKKNIQMIFQDPAACLNERANVDYIISEGIYNFKMFKSKEERLAKVTSLLNSVGLLPEHLSRYPHEFSGGQRQRIGIARALAIEPSLVLADEPISALDVSIRAQVLNLLKKLQKENGLTYLFIAHDLSIIRYISDRIAVMHNGYIVELGIAEEIYTHPLHPYTRSLITAIPQPDPKTKDQRKKIRYEQGDMVYEKCVWKEMRPGHFVLVDDKLEKDIEERIKTF